MASFWGNLDEEKEKKSNPDESKIAIRILIIGLILIVLSSIIQAFF